MLTVDTRTELEVADTINRQFRRRGLAMTFGLALAHAGDRDGAGIVMNPRSLLRAANEAAREWQANDTSCLTSFEKRRQGVPAWEHVAKIKAATAAMDEALSQLSALEGAVDDIVDELWAS